jgi:hypothetical protein
VPEDKNDSIRPGQQMLVGQFAIHDDVHSIEIPCIRPMPRENMPSELTLQGRKSKHPRRIPPQDELH